MQTSTCCYQSARDTISFRLRTVSYRRVQSQTCVRISLRDPARGVRCSVLKEQGLVSLTAAASHMAPSSMTFAAVDTAGGDTPLFCEGRQRRLPRAKSPVLRPLRGVSEDILSLSPSCPALSTQGSHWQGAEDRPVGLKHDSGRNGGLGCRSGHQIFSLVPLDMHLVWLFFPSNLMTVLRPLTRAPVSPFPAAKWRVSPADWTGFLILRRTGGHKHGA